MNKVVAPASALLLTLSLLLTACNSAEIRQGDSPRGTLRDRSTTSPNTTLPSTTAIPIGAAFSQSSNYALLAQESVAGAKIAEKYFNDRGGVNGTPIKLVFQDTGGDEAGAINAVQTLINQDGYGWDKWQVRLFEVTRHFTERQLPTLQPLERKAVKYSRTKEQFQRENYIMA